MTWVDLPHQSMVQRIKKFKGNFRTVSESIVKFVEALELCNNQYK